ncbi:MAG: metallophosphoesterase [Candidatus Omnitrophica bacterium]|nr:metallophosphoesterase [Candidatus Omnitrophota bacterium]
MPFVLTSQSNRRNFLRTAIIGAGALAAPHFSFGQDAKSARWAFLSDTHVPRDPSNEYRGFHPFDNMKKTTADIASAQPEGAIITGDLARLEGFNGDYASLKTVCDPILQTMPVCMALGNHDNRSNFLNAFHDHPGKQNVSGKHVSVIEAGPVRFIVLDSLLSTNITPGQLGKNQREWLRAFLKEAQPKPTLLFFHHTMTDADGSLVDVERLFPIIVPSDQVKAIVYGHSHVYDFQEKMGIQLINIPAVGYNFSDQDPVGWIEAELTAQDGRFTLHTIGGNQDNNGQTTTVKWRV